MTRQLFVTPLFEAVIDRPALLADLAHSILTLARDDEAGRRWSREHQYAGYTSYASLSDLPRRDPAFAELATILGKNARSFAKELGWDHKPKLDSLWVNAMKPGGHHAAHIHPHAVLSGTFYVDVPGTTGSIRFEDPRLAMMMAAPVRTPDADEALQTFVDVGPRPGLLLLWESWLRHEVRPHRGPGERLSVSFNFA